MTRVTIAAGNVGAGHDGVARELAPRLSADDVEVSVLEHLADTVGRLAWTQWERRAPNA